MGVEGRYDKIDTRHTARLTLLKVSELNFNDDAEKGTDAVVSELEVVQNHETKHICGLALLSKFSNIAKSSNV